MSTPHKAESSSGGVSLGGLEAAGPIEIIEGNSEMVQKVAGPKLALDVATDLVNAFLGGIVKKGGSDGGGGGGHGHH